MEPRDYLSVALQRLDLLLHREILRLCASYQLSLDEFRGLYISDEQVNQLINRSVNYEGPSSAIDELTQKAESLRADSKCRTDSSPWHKLVTEFSLSLIEQDILLLAVAPEIDLKYETLFAYLNNDITRKWPTFDLALRDRRCRCREKNRRAALPVAGSEALQQRIAATDQLGPPIDARGSPRVFQRRRRSANISRTPHHSIRAWRHLSSSEQRRSIGSGYRFLPI